MYAQVLGPSYAALDGKVRELHDLGGRSVWTGEADVERGTSWIARLGALVAGLPPTGAAQHLNVTFTTENGGETWRREFGNTVFLSHQQPGDGVVLERAGPVLLTLSPQVLNGSLVLGLSRMHVLAIPVPRFLLPIVATREYENTGRYHFEVEARLPWFGRIIRYAGWLEPARS